MNQHTNARGCPQTWEHRHKTPGQGSPTRGRTWVGLLVAITVIGGCKHDDPPSTAPVVPKQSASSDKSESSVTLTEKALTKNPIHTASVAAAHLSPDVDVIGSVAVSQDHVAIIGPLVGGRIARLQARVGDQVKTGQVLAVIESAEVGEAQAIYLTARAQLNAAEANLRRESDLVKQRISSEREYEIALANATTERARLKAAVERLSAIGFSPSDISGLERNGYRGGQVPMRASIAGTVIDRMVTLGQAVEKATDAFKIANLEKLWVLLDVYEKDLAKVNVGQEVLVRTEVHAGKSFKAKVTYIDNVIDEATRTTHVRIEFDNPDGQLRIGQLVTARILGDPDIATQEVLAIPRTAVQSIEGKPLVFVKDPQSGSFRRRVVQIGNSGGDLVEVMRGLRAGEVVATDGAFLLKSELLR